MTTSLGTAFQTASWNNPIRVTTVGNTLVAQPSHSAAAAANPTNRFMTGLKVHTAMYTNGPAEGLKGYGDDAVWVSLRGTIRNINGQRNDKRMTIQVMVIMVNTEERIKEVKARRGRKPATSRKFREVVKGKIVGPVYSEPVNFINDGDYTVLTLSFSEIKPMLNQQGEPLFCRGNELVTLDNLLVQRGRSCPRPERKNLTQLTEVRSIQRSVPQDSGAKEHTAQPNMALVSSVS